MSIPTSMTAALKWLCAPRDGPLLVLLALVLLAVGMGLWSRRTRQ